MREKAVNEIKRLLADEMGSYIISNSSNEVKKNNEAFEQNFTRNTQVFSMSHMKTTIIEERRRDKLFYVKVQITIDEDNLKSEFQNAGIDYNTILSKVFEMMMQNNVASVSTIVINTTNALLADLNLLENINSGLRIYNVSKNFQGQISDGNTILNGNFKIIYRSGNYSVINLNNGYLHNLYELFDKDNNLIEKGNYADNYKEGVWEYYSVLRNYRFMAKTNEYNKGMLNGNSTVYNNTGYGNIESITVFENDIPVSMQIFDNDNYVFKGNLDKYGKKQGSWTSYQNEILASVSNFDNGQKHGEFISYYTNGQIWSKGSYFNDKETGKFYSYYRNGQLEEEKEYTNGTRSGNTIQYYENGNIKIEYLNHNNGNKTINRYFENGNLKSEEFFIPGKYSPVKHGRFTEYFDNGNLKGEINYSNNEKVGLCADYFNDGTIQQSKTYVISNGKSVLHGSVVEYDDNRQLIKSTNYNKGINDGIHAYYSDGIIYQEESYKNGTMLYEKKYYKSGNIQFETLYNVTANYVIKNEYYDNSQIKSITHYKPSNTPGQNQLQKEGEYKQYTMEGILIKECSYINNKANGENIEYLNSGEIKLKENFLSGIREGLYVTYWRGNPKEMGTYTNGKRSGIWLKIISDNEAQESTYDSNGNLIDKQTISGSDNISNMVKKYNF